MTEAKRALILAGGGLKVGFQAGVLEVWLDEAGLTFAHADGASGGCFNLAMYCQGYSGRRIADNWRNLNPFLPVDLNWEQYWKLSYAPSLFTYDNFRRKVLPFWGIDWKAINSSTRLGTFNIYNFSRKQLEVKDQQEMDEDFLIASVSLPMWFPPVRIKGQTYFDAVFITDANLEEAIRRGADEIWAIWTVSTKDEWRDGFVAQYFQLIEAMADAHFFGMWRRLEANNSAFKEGKKGEFGRPITLKLLQAEVPIHYLFNFSKDRMAECVNLGVDKAREWCKEEGVPFTPGPAHPIDIHTAETRLEFTEEMKGFVSPKQTDYELGWKEGKKNKNTLGFRLTIAIDGVNRFVTRPQHEAVVSGWVQSPLHGGRCRVERGTFNLLVDKGDPAHKQMLYRLYFRDNQEQPFTLVGVKEVRDVPGFDAWEDTTTLYTKVLPGHVRVEDEQQTPVHASGILKLSLTDFLQQLTTFRVEGPTPHDRIAALNRFGRLFMGKLWDVYAQQWLTYSPL